MPPELPVLDLRTFEQIAARLAPDAVASYLRTIAELGEALLLAWGEAGPLIEAGDALAAAAHTLAGRAGMLGFQRLSVIGRSFERAVQTGAAEAPLLADQLSAAIEATIQQMTDSLMSTHDNPS